MLTIPDTLPPLSCSIIAVHPWVHGVGQQTETGAYLSPANALAYLAARLAGQGGQSDVIVLLVAADCHDNFIEQLTALAGVFPAPAFTQVARLATSSAALATVKMQRPAAANARPPAMPLSVPSTRNARNAMRIATAQAEAAASARCSPVPRHLLKNRRIWLPPATAGWTRSKARAPGHGYSPHQAV